MHSRWLMNLFFRGIKVNKNNRLYGRGRLINDKNEILRNGGYDFIAEFAFNEYIKVGISLCHPRDYYSKEIGNFNSSDNLFLLENSRNYSALSVIICEEELILAAKEKISPIIETGSLDFHDLTSNFIGEFIHTEVIELYKKRFKQYIQKHSINFKTSTF